MDPIVLLAALGMAGLAGSLVFAVWRAGTRDKQAEAFEDALAKMTGAERTDTALLREAKPRTTWTGFWRSAFERTGRVPADPAQPGRTAAGVAVVAAFAGFAVAGPLYAPLAALAGPAAMLGWLRFEQSRRRAAIDKQLPLLLAALRSQLQSGVTPAQAVLRVAEELPAPIGDEIRRVRDDLNVAVSLDAALGKLAERSKSELMGFLVASIGIAVRGGSDLVPQLVVIEETVRQRARIDGKIRSALAMAKPTTWIAMAAPPAMAAYLIFSDPAYLDFYGTVEGLITLAVALGAYALGVFIMRVMVSNLERV